MGSSVDIINRWNAHRHTFKKEPIYNSRLISAVRKHGIENFTFMILEECEPVKETLLALEQHYIDTLKPEYNILPIAGSNLGFKMPPSFFEKIKDREPWNKNTIGLQEAWNKGVPMTEEQKLKLKEANIGREPWNKGVEMSEEIKQKLSEALKGREVWNKGVSVDEAEKQRLYEMWMKNNTPEHQTKMTEAAKIVNTGKERSEETKKKISQSNRASEARKAFAQSVTGIPRTEEVKQKVSEGIKSSQAFQESVKARFGKSTKKDGVYGVIYDKSRNKYQVRVNKKQYGRFNTMEEAIAKRDTIMAELTASE